MYHTMEYIVKKGWATNICGIFGAITKGDYNLSETEAKKRNNILRGLALAMEKRGIDSTGIAGVNRNEVSLFKKALPAHEFINTKGFVEVLEQNNKIVIGHTRLATVGEVSNRNAHPFTFGNITGVHNGHVSNYLTVGHEDIEVDSEAIFYLLNKYNNDYTKAFSELTGGFALAWFDKRKPTELHLVSKGNPIKLIYINEIKTYFFASEEYPLASIVGSHFLIDEKKIWSPVESKVYTLDTKGQTKTHSVEFKKWVSSPYPAHYYSSDNSSPQYGLPDDERDTPPDTKYNYESLHGGKNPFAPSEENETIALDAIDEVYQAEVKIILEGIEEKGCYYCGKLIHMEEDSGCYLYSIGDKLEDKHIICCECKNSGQISPKNLTWIGMDEYVEILEEVEEYRDAKNLEAYLKQHAKERATN